MISKMEIWSIGVSAKSHVFKADYNLLTNFCLDYINALDFETNYKDALGHQVF